MTKSRKKFDAAFKAKIAIEEVRRLCPSLAQGRSMFGMASRWSNAIALFRSKDFSPPDQGGSRSR
jgi:hypothetical protein